MRRPARCSRRRGLLKGTIGIERDSLFFPAEAFERYVKGFDGVKLGDGSGIVKSLMRVKSPAEVEVIRQAGS